jgi:hypothetical protein
LPKSKSKGLTKETWLVKVLVLLMWKDAGTWTKVALRVSNPKKALKWGEGFFFLNRGIINISHHKKRDQRKLRIVFHRKIPHITGSISRCNTSLYNKYFHKKSTWCHTKVAAKENFTSNQTWLQNDHREKYMIKIRRLVVDSPLL